MAPRRVARFLHARGRQPAPIARPPSARPDASVPGRLRGPGALERARPDGRAATTPSLQAGFDKTMSALSRRDDSRDVWRHAVPCARGTTCVPADRPPATRPGEKERAAAAGELAGTGAPRRASCASRCPTTRERGPRRQGRGAGRVVETVSRGCGPCAGPHDPPPTPQQSESQRWGTRPATAPPAPLDLADRATSPPPPTPSCRRPHPGGSRLCRVASDAGA